MLWIQGCLFGRRKGDFGYRGVWWGRVALWGEVLLGYGVVGGMVVVPREGRWLLEIEGGDYFWMGEYFFGETFFGTSAKAKVENN